MNNSYVYIPVDKFAELVETSCPPNYPVSLRRCYSDEDCAKCWREWASKESEDNNEE